MANSNILIGKILPIEPRLKFTESSPQYHRAVDYLYRKHEIERAAGVYRGHKDFNMAASIYEQAGDFKSAGNEYLNSQRI